MARESTEEPQPESIPFSPKTRIVTHCVGYQPPFDVGFSISRMIATVPLEYLNGLDEIVLTNTDCLSRSRRRSVTKSRKRKVRIATARGLYHAAWQGKAAWVEIFVDNSLSSWNRIWWLRLPVVRDIQLTTVLFHEIGHHIHATRPAYREREDVADEWMDKLSGRYFRKQYRWLIPLFYCLRLFRRPIEKAYRQASFNLSNLYSSLRRS